MNRQIRFTHAAEIDYYESLAWYEAREAGLGTRFEQVIEEAVRRIREQPERFRATGIRFRNYLLRKMVVQRFPFAIFFVVTSIEVFVLAVFHTSRDPREVADRMAQ